MKSVVLSTDKSGHLTQCHALADLLPVKIDETIRLPGSNSDHTWFQSMLEKRMRLIKAISLTWKYRSGQIFILSSGQSVLPACALLRRLRGRNVLILHVGSPKGKWHCADVILRSNHQKGPSEAQSKRYKWDVREIWVEGLICRALPEGRAGQKIVTVLLGGRNKTFQDDETAMADTLDRIESLAGTLDVRIVFSRRTRAAVAQTVRDRFRITGVTIVERDDRAGYLAACADAGAFIVTPDSISMVSEACATGKPVYLADLPVKNAETNNYRFIRSFHKAGSVTPLGQEIEFDRREVQRPDVDVAMAEIREIITAWQRISAREANHPPQG